MTNKKCNEERYFDFSNLLYSLILDQEALDDFKEKYKDEMLDLEKTLFCQLENYVVQMSTFAKAMYIAMKDKNV